MKLRKGQLHGRTSSGGFAKASPAYGIALLHAAYPQCVWSLPHEHTAFFSTSFFGASGTTGKEIITTANNAVLNVRCGVLCRHESDAEIPHTCSIR